MKFKLKTGETVLVDDADAYKALAFTWHRAGDGYVATCYRDENGHPHCFYLKELLTGLRHVRFRNRNRLDHRRKNFIIAPSPAPGVTWKRNNRRWEVMVNRKYIGSYRTLEKAMAVRRHYGRVKSRVWALPKAALGKDRRSRIQYLQRLYHPRNKVAREE